MGNSVSRAKEIRRVVELTPKICSYSGDGQDVPSLRNSGNPIRSVVAGDCLKGEPLDDSSNFAQKLACRLIFDLSVDRRPRCCAGVMRVAELNQKR